MRNLLKLAALFVLLTSAFGAAQAQKFGYLNSAAILAEMPEVKGAEATLQALQTQLQKRMQASVEQLQQDYTAVQQKVERGELSPRQQEEEAARLRTREEQLQADEQAMSTQLQNKRTELLEPIYARVTEAINSVAQENGFTMIFDQQVLLYSEPDGDVSELVKAKLAGN